jgi:hypothetical protein
VCTVGTEQPHWHQHLNTHKHKDKLKVAPVAGKGNRQQSKLKRNINDAAIIIMKIMIIATGQSARTNCAINKYGSKQASKKGMCDPRASQQQQSLSIIYLIFF